MFFPQQVADCSIIKNAVVSWSMIALRLQIRDQVTCPCRLFDNQWSSDQYYPKSDHVWSSTIRLRSIQTDLSKTISRRNSSIKIPLSFGSEVLQFPCLCWLDHLGIPLDHLGIPAISQASLLVFPPSSSLRRRYFLRNSNHRRVGFQSSIDSGHARDTWNDLSPRRESRQIKARRKYSHADCQMVESQRVSGYRITVTFPYRLPQQTACPLRVSIDHRGTVSPSGERGTPLIIDLSGGLVDGSRCWQCTSSCIARVCVSYALGLARVGDPLRLDSTSPRGSLTAWFSAIHRASYAIHLLCVCVYMCADVGKKSLRQWASEFRFSFEIQGIYRRDKYHGGEKERGRGGGRFGDFRRAKYAAPRVLAEVCRARREICIVVDRESKWITSRYSTLVSSFRVVYRFVHVNSCKFVCCVLTS